MRRKEMKNLIKFLSIVSLSFILLVGCSSGGQTTTGKSTLAQAKENGVLVVGSSNDTPFAYIDKDTKQFTGIDAEIIKEVAKRLGIPKVEMKEVKFENLLVELNNKNIDIVTDGMYIKPERQKIANFTDVWYKEGEALNVRKGSTIK
jgi:polar amino acid transport system substrate-binding protein